MASVAQDDRMRVRAQANEARVRAGVPTWPEIGRKVVRHLDRNSPRVQELLRNAKAGVSRYGRAERR